jgi:hypothetical protein
MSRSSRSGIAWLLIAVTASAMFSIPLTLLSPNVVAAAGPACFNYTATSAADLVRTEVSSPGFLVVEETDAEGPAAQAHTDSLGNSLGYAAVLYPGDAAMSAFGLANLPRSTYPLVSESSYPARQTNQLSSGPFSMNTEAKSNSSSSTVTGAAVALGEATSAHDNATASVSCSATGVVSASSTNAVEAVDIGGVLKLGTVTSTATAVLGSDGHTQLTADLKITGASVNGVAVSIDQSGINAAGTTVPVPNSSPTAALAASGISLTYLSQSEDPDGQGILAPGIMVRVTRNAVGTGPSVITYTIGRAFARSSGSAVDVSNPSSDGGYVPAGTTGGGLAPTSGSVAAAQSPLLSPIGAIPRHTAQRRPNSTAAPLFDTGQGLAAFARANLNWRPLYLALLFAAVVLAGGIAVFRLVGGRSE